MRTTVIIDDQVLREAKARAAEQSTSLSKLIEGALRRELASATPEPAERFVMPVFAGPEGGDTRGELTPEEVWRLVEGDDLATLEP